MFMIYWIGPVQYKPLVACIDLNASNTNMEGNGYETHMIVLLATREQSQVMKPLHLGAIPS